MDLSVRRIDLAQLGDGGVFQSPFWARLKALNGWQALPVEVEGRGTCLVLVRRIARVFTLAYIPLGLGFLKGEDEVAAFSRAIRPLLPGGCLLLRVDLDWGHMTTPHILKPCSASVQPTGTVRIDLTGELDFKDRARRNLRKEEGIVIRLWDGDEETFHKWYETYVHTALRDHFSTRGEDYLRAIFDIADGNVRPLLYLAYSDGEVSGGILNLRTDREEVYLFGSSVKHTSGVSCGYALQTHAILCAKAAGVATYDLFGIEGADESGSHLASLTTFKTAFGGQRVYRTGTMDYVYRPVMGRLFRFVDSLRFRQARRSRI